MAKRRKKCSKLNRSRRMVVGMIVRWSDTSPEMDSSGFMPGEVTHRSLVYAPIAGDLFSRMKDWIVDKQHFFWRLDIGVVFKRDDGAEWVEHRELYTYCVLADLGYLSLQQFEDAKCAGNERFYSHTNFEVECLSTDANYQVEAA